MVPGEFLSLGTAVASIPHVYPLARSVFVSSQEGKKAAAVDFQVGGNLCSGGVAEGREEVGEVDDVLLHLTGLYGSGPIRDEGDAVAGIRHGALAALDDGSVYHFGGYADVGAVVAGEDNEGVFADAEVVQLGDDFLHHFVDVGHHVLKVGLVPFALWPFLGFGGIPVLAVGGGLERPVGKDHRIIGEEGALLVAVHEIAQVVGHDLGSVFPVAIVYLLAVHLDPGIGVSAGTAGKLPKAILVEPELVGSFESPLQLPLSCDASLVSGFFDQVAEGGGPGVEESESDVVAKVRDTGHYLDSAWGADGLGMGVLEAHAVAGQAVEKGRLVVGPSIGSEAFVAHVVGHDEDDVGRFLGGRNDRGERKGEEDECREDAHGRDGSLS